MNTRTETPAAETRSPPEGVAGSARRTALQKTGALRDAIFNSERFSCIATDEAGVIQIFNAGAERMLGYPAAEVLNKFTPAELSDQKELIARAAALSLEFSTPISPGFEALAYKAARGIEDIYELTRIRKDGSRFPAVVSVTALRDAQEHIIGYLLIGTDNSARKEIEHAALIKSEFLATMSHELRTPLNAIIGFSEALKDGLMGNLSDVQREYMGDIFSSGQHLLSLINDILDLSKVEAGMMALEPEPVDLKLLLTNSLTIVRERAAARRILLELEAGEDLGLIRLDLRRTKQIVHNLLANAIKFSAIGGRVRLRARRVPRGSVGVLPGAWPALAFPMTDKNSDEFVEICVCDNGIGISRENMAKLFQPFTQIDTSLARKFEGTGLGLAMVRQLTELHGGAVAVASEEGKGAQFAVWLPLHAPEQPGARLRGNAAATAPNAGPGERVALVVEDDALSADLIRLLLEGEGFTVLHAASAEAALLLASRQPLSLITLDIQLPGIDGWEFLERIRKDSALARVPVVIIAGLDYSNMVLAGGAAAVLEKPVSRAELKASLATLGLQPTGEHTCKVLVVDDDPKAVEVIAAFLPAPAYAVTRAYGGAEAIVLAQQLRPDLILLDLLMPEVSGFDVVAALQNNPDTARIPVLVVTAKPITAEDRSALNGHPGTVINIVEKSGFNKIGFIAEVRRALAPPLPAPLSVRLQPY